jgi:hypothetical protein
MNGICCLVEEIGIQDKRKFFRNWIGVAKGAKIKNGGWKASGKME